MSRRVFTAQAHQEEMQEHVLAHERCAIFAPMGSGKTAGILSMLQALELVEPGGTLVVAPKRVALSVWPDEAAKWEHLSSLSIAAIIGTEAERARALRRDVAVHTINYENLQWLMRFMYEHKIRWPWTRVVADESTRLKSFRLKGGGSVRARHIGAIADRPGYVKRWINLTGTPSPNGLRDLWGQTWYLDQGQRLGRTINAFDDRFFRWRRKPNPTKANYEIQQDPLPHAHAEITALLSDICLTPTLPYSVDEPVVRPVYVELPPSARAQYEEMEKKMFAEIGEHEVEAFTSATKTMKCLQMASGSVWVDSKAGVWAEMHDVKLQALESIVEEAAGMPILVRYHWVPSKERILRAFPRARVLDDNPETIRRWNAGKIPMLVAHAGSCGHGLNLQDGSNILASFDHWWDLEQAAQVIERIGPLRQKQSGYNRHVFHYPIIARDTVDELVLARIETKRSVQDLLVEAMKRKRA